MKQSLPWIDTAVSLIGTHEVAGTKNNPVILAWARKIGGWIAEYYNKDSIPWCGLFVGHCMQANGFETFSKMLSALAWNSYGTKLNEPYYGCIIVFKRKGGGHVGFAISQDKNYYHVLGGNQSDSVNVTKVAKNRCVGWRWPDYYQLPTVKLPYKTFNGKVSTNEA